MYKKRLFERFQRYGSNDEGIEKTVTLAREIGSGFRHEIQLDRGLKLYIENYALKERMTARVIPEKIPMGISVCISGRLNWTPAHPGPCPTFTTRAGQMDLSLSRANTEPGFIECLPGEPVLLISLLVTPERMGLSQGRHQALAALSRLPLSCRGIPGHFAYAKHHTAPQVDLAARQIMTCSLGGPAKQLYMTGKAMELMALVLDRFTVQNQVDSPVIPPGRRSPALSPGDREQLGQARKILDRSFASPPCLAHLARQTGLNQTKLKKGFKQLFHTTISAHILDCRMKKARRLLQEGNTTVSEVAWAVGYANRSHFTRAFTRTFGFPPVVLLRSGRSEGWDGHGLHGPDRI